MSEWLLWENSRIGPSNTPTPGECCIRLSCCTSALCGFIYLWLSQISFLGARSDCRSSGSVAVINASSLIVCCKLNWAGTSCHCSATSCCIVCVLLARHCLLAVCMSICLCEMHPPSLSLLEGEVLWGAWGAERPGGGSHRGRAQGAEGCHYPADSMGALWRRVQRRGGKGAGLLHASPVNVFGQTEAAWILQVF